jgi:hypothetical protein
MSRLLLGFAALLGVATLVFANLAAGVKSGGAFFVMNSASSGQEVMEPFFLADLYFSTSTNAPTDSFHAAGFNVPFSTTTAGGESAVGHCT